MKKYSNRQLRQALREKKFLVFTWRGRAIRRAKALTKQYRIVYYVTKSVIGYYVLNLEDVHRLNVHEMKKKGGKKIRERDLDKICEWRSPFYNTL